MRRHLVQLMPLSKKLSPSGMHLGVNLRKAQNVVIHEYERESINPVGNELDSTEENEQLTTNQRREYIPTDNFVHGFCKLLGQHGTPEYGQGNSLRDYIIHELAKSKLNGNNDRTHDPVILGNVKVDFYYTMFTLTLWL